MTIELPDINIDTASIEELRQHSHLCAAAENELRSHVISVHSRIIVLVDEHNTRTGSSQVVLVKKRKQPSTKDILSESLEDQYSIDDFR